MVEMKTITLEQAQKVAALAAAVNSVGTDAAAFATAREAMVSCVKDKQPFIDYIEGGCGLAITGHSTLLGLLAVEAEKLRDTEGE